jgi:hypothetical protein
LKIELLESFLRLFPPGNVDFDGNRGLRPALGIHQRRNAGIHPDERAILAQEAPFEFERQPLLHQALEGLFVFGDIVGMHEFPYRFAEQLCFAVSQHLAERFIDEDQVTRGILANDPGRCLPEDGLEAFF